MAQKQFRGRLIADGHGGASLRMQIPFSVEEAYGTRGRVAVKARFGKTEFRTSLLPNGDGTHYLMVNRDMQTAGGAGANQTVSVTLSRDAAGEDLVVPGDLAAAVAKNKLAARNFAELPPSARRLYVRWVESARLAQTRAGRIASAVKMLAAGKRRPDL